MMTELKIKLLSETAKAPVRAREGDAGLDIFSDESVCIKAGGSCLVNSNVAVAIPSHCVGQIWPRSGLSVRHKIETGAGVIDSNYRGPIKVHLYNFSNEDYEISHGDRIAQLLIIPIMTVNLLEVPELDDTNRGDAGFLSSGMKEITV